MLVELFALCYFIQYECFGHKFEHQNTWKELSPEERQRAMIGMAGGCF